MNTIKTPASFAQLAAVPRSSSSKRAQIVCGAAKRGSGAVAGAAESFKCYSDLDAADAFNSCYLNFDQLTGEQVTECVSVARKVVREAKSADVCNAEVCTKREHADWFARYFSNEFGLE